MIPDHCPAEMTDMSTKETVRKLLEDAKLGMDTPVEQEARVIEPRRNGTSNGTRPSTQPHASPTPITPIHFPFPT